MLYFTVLCGGKKVRWEDVRPLWKHRELTKHDFKSSDSEVSCSRLLNCLWVNALVSTVRMLTQLLHY